MREDVNTAEEVEIVLIAEEQAATRLVEGVATVVEQRPVHNV